MAELSPEQQRLFEIFHPLAAEKHAKAIKEGTRFVYYTGAETAMKIIRDRRMWMRKAICMNDFSEIQHGLTLLYKAYHGDQGIRLRKIMDGIFPDIRSEVEKTFDTWSAHLKFDTYLTCVSEHTATDDVSGRLSMWRAYGGSTGVAFVMKADPFYSTLPSDALKIYASPVEYCDETKFAVAFKKVVDSLDENSEFLKAQSRKDIVGRFYRMLTFAAVCTKHPAFEEELEWRVVHFPWLEESNYMRREIEAVQGVPQPVFKIPLEDVFEGQQLGLGISALLDRIIIGPTRDPIAVRDGFAFLLEKAGEKEPFKKVYPSWIPLRQ
jgi:Protein of unknown function (DUF2971)